MLPLMAEMVRRSAWRGLKSVEARTISSPTRHCAASSTSMEVAPALGGRGKLGPGVGAVVPCRFSVPPESMMPRSPMPLHVFVLDVVGEGDGGLVRVNGLGLGADGAARRLDHRSSSVVSSRSRSSAKVSLPLIVRPRSAGGLTSSSTSVPRGMVTFSPAAGTLPEGHAEASDHFTVRVIVALGGRAHRHF